MNQRGAGLIVVIVILLVVGVILAVFVSLINTESFSAMGQSARVRAFGIADGGIEYALKRASETTGFPNYSFPLYSQRGVTPNIALGDGSFFVDPPTVVADDPLSIGATTVNVVSTTGFADPALTGEDVMITIDQERIQCTGKTATSFTGCTRGVATPPNPTSHAIDSGVYPVTELDSTIPAGCGVDPISVESFAKLDSAAGFLLTGTISIGTELIHYTGVTFNAGDKIESFTGLTRCYRGTCDCVSDPPSAHAVNKPVYQYVITSTGTVPLPVIGNAQRVVRITVGVLN